MGSLRKVASSNRISSQSPHDHYDRAILIFKIIYIFLDFRRFESYRILEIFRLKIKQYVIGRIFLISRFWRIYYSLSYLNTHIKISWIFFFKNSTEIIFINLLFLPKQLPKLPFIFFGNIAFISIFSHLFKLWHEILFLNWFFIKSEIFTTLISNLFCHLS